MWITTHRFWPWFDVLFTLTSFALILLHFQASHIYQHRLWWARHTETSAGFSVWAPLFTCLYWPSPADQTFPWTRSVVTAVHSHFGTAHLLITYRTMVPSRAVPPRQTSSQVQSWWGADSAEATQVCHSPAAQQLLYVPPVYLILPHFPAFPRTVFVVCWAERVFSWCQVNSQTLERIEKHERPHSPCGSKCHWGTRGCWKAIKIK